MLNFRTVQGMTVASIVGMWIVRSLTQPTFHWHTTMLVMAVLVGAASEVGYRAGLRARDEDTQED